MIGTVTKQRDIRKYENSMATSGLAVIAFGIWSIIKAGLLLLVAPEKFKAQLGLEEFAEDLAKVDENTATVVYIAVAVGVVLVLALDLGMRVKVGLAARREGMGGKKMGKGNMILAILLVVLLTLSVTSNIIEIVHKGIDDSTDTRAIAVLIDMTALTACIQLIYSAFKLRKLRKEA